MCFTEIKVIVYCEVTSSFLSTAYCAAGKELGASGKCEPCQRGFYKDNVNEVARFDKCTACPVKLITADTGATSQDNCTQGKLLLEP